MELKKEYERFWSEEGISKDFFYYNRNYILPKIFVKPSHQKKILDIACGAGVVSLFLKHQGYTVVGLDLSINALRKAKRGDIKFLINGSSEIIPINSETFDIVFCGDLLEHLINPEYCLQEINRVLKKGGVLVLSVPNMGFYGARLITLITGNVYNNETSGNPPWRWQHIRFYNIKILRSLLREFNFKIEEVYGAPILKNEKSDFSWRMIPFRLIILLMRYLQKITFSKIINLSDILVITAVKRES